MATGATAGAGGTHRWHECASVTVGRAAVSGAWRMEPRRRALSETLDVWTTGLEDWYVANGRHALPWRRTADPWAVLVSELMLQQTSVARVLPRWSTFLGRWPAAADCAAASLEEVLREWQGLGYPRRARALWLTARQVTEGGWPPDEARLRALPGVGVYTARALMAFSSLGRRAAGEDVAPPRDVNLARVAARAGLGVEPHQAAPAALDRVLRAARPVGMPWRDYVYALFDVGSMHCRARPRCPGCPAATECLALRRTGGPERAPRRQLPYAGSLRQLRGAVLAASLAAPGASATELAAAVHDVPGATPERTRAALDGLVRDGLVRRPPVPGREHGDATADGTGGSRR